MLTNHLPMQCYGLSKSQTIVLTCNQWRILNIIVKYCFGQVERAIFVSILVPGLGVSLCITHFYHSQEKHDTMFQIYLVGSEHQLDVGFAGTTLSKMLHISHWMSDTCMNHIIIGPGCIFILSRGFDINISSLENSSLCCFCLIWCWGTH